jgi:protoporphyrinogen oxidase
MKVDKIDTLILGAGPSGLAAGYVLAKAGRKPVVLEKDKVPGGLMRSIKHGEFTMDVGRKELYNRLAKVDALWSEILGNDYRDYPHRGGILYQGRIIDTSPVFQGFRRGLPLSMFVGCMFDFLRARVKPGAAEPRNVEEYFYQTRGRQLTQIFSQGFQEKLAGRKWADIPLPENYANGAGSGFASTVKEALVRAFSKKEVNTYKGIWRHPAKGSGQISEIFAQEIVRLGGSVHYQARVMEMTTLPEDGRQKTEDRNASSAIRPLSSVLGLQRIDIVTAQIGAETVCFKPSHVVSSIPPEFLKRLLFAQPVAEPLVAPKSNEGGPVAPKSNEGGPVTPKSNEGGSARSLPAVAGPAPKRTVVLVYLFLDEEPRFPHAWLNVTCPNTKIGRITNYSAFNGDMVPKGKTCLCCEFYCFGPDPLLEMDNKDIARLALEDCARDGLVDLTKCFEQLVLRFPGADASQNRDNWMSKSRLKLLSELERFKNLYYVNRTETDIATLAGMEAAEAIFSGDRTHFDRRMDPAELGIRSESKAFEFQNPVTG